MSQIIAHDLAVLSTDDIFNLSAGLIDPHKATARIHAFIENSDRRIAEFLSEGQAQKLVNHNRRQRERKEAARAASERRREARKR